jgi:hypothetical protein
VDKGIIIIAIGNPFYGTRAYNLCVTLKMHEPVSVTLVYDAGGVSHLSEGKKTLFDNLIEIPIEYTYVNGKREILKPKTFLNVLSPYSETIYMDADTLWNPTKRVQNIFDEMAGVDFTIANRGYTTATSGMGGFSMWANIEDIRSAHQIDEYLDASSEFIYWKKGEKADEIFSMAQAIFESDPVTYRYFAGGKPDEPAFSIALSKLSFKPHRVPYFPGYWFFHTPSKYPSRSEILSNHYYISFGGNQGNDWMRKLYEDISTDCFHRSGVEGPFPYIEKNKSIKERIPV